MPNTYDGPGRGRKQCQSPDCDVYTHVRVKACPVCSTPFRVQNTPSKQRPESKPAKPVEPKKPMHAGPPKASDGRPILYATPDRCPIDLPAPKSKRAIRAWVDELRNLYPKYHLAPSVFLSWIRPLYAPGTKGWCLTRDYVVSTITHGE